MNDVDDDGFTALHYAARYNRLAVVEVLVKAGAGLSRSAVSISVFNKNDYRLTALYLQDNPDELVPASRRQEHAAGALTPTSRSIDQLIITSPAGAVAKYCDEYVCLCVCLYARISPEPHARSLPIFVRVAYVRGSVLLRHVDDRPHRLSAGRG